MPEPPYWNFTDLRCSNPFTAEETTEQLLGMKLSFDRRWLAVEVPAGKIALIDTDTNHCVRKFLSAPTQRLLGNLCILQGCILQKIYWDLWHQLPLPTNPSASEERFSTTEVRSWFGEGPDGSIVYEAGQELCLLLHNGESQLLARYDEYLCAEGICDASLGLIAFFLENESASESTAPFTLVVFRIGEGEVFRTRIEVARQADTFPHFRIALDPQGRWIAAAESNATELLCWSLLTQEALPSKKVGSVSQLVASPDGSALACLSSYRDVFVWRIEDTEPYASFSSPDVVYAMQWSHKQLYFLKAKHLLSVHGVLSATPPTTTLSCVAL